MGSTMHWIAVIRRAPLSGGAKTMMRQFVAGRMWLRWTIVTLENGPLMDELRRSEPGLSSPGMWQRRQIVRADLLAQLRESGIEDAVRVLSRIDVAHSWGPCEIVEDGRNALQAGYENMQSWGI